MEFWFFVYGYNGLDGLGVWVVVGWRSGVYFGEGIVGCICCGDFVVVVVMAFGWSGYIIDEYGRLVGWLGLVIFFYLDLGGFGYFWVLCFYGLVFWFVECYFFVGFDYYY